ncbi:hypothetical protein L6164_011263 [Bauhinia variegata]|uniref:Uncharacterized protein n=1 Tax=Bauhinia variegata TaxID=167791 RepID=A0ACB9P690_BAUVA|nr:hypothetical protein L6164_011263 [Bauhinia variegata]
MQSFLRKLSTHYPKLSDTSRSLFYSHAHRTFSSLSKPAQAQVGDHICSSFHFQLWRPHHTLFGKFRGSLSEPLLANQFVLNSCNRLQRISSRSLIDVWPRLLRAQFRRSNFDFNRSLDSYSRGWGSWFRRLQSSDVVLGLIVANVAVFLLWRVADEQFMSNNFTISVENFRSGRLHTLITNAFSHIDIEHIISNMIGLYFFGTNIGRSFGPEFLLKLYLAGALGGSVFYLVHQAFLAQSSKGRRGRDPSKAQALGASGAVNAIMLLDIFLFPKATLYLDFIFPVPAILLGIFLIGKDVLRIIEGDRHISGSAHMGGAAVAAVAWARVRRGRF